MANDYFDPSGVTVSNGITGVAEDVNDVSSLVEAAFDKLPTETEFKEETTTYALDTGAADAYVVSLTYTPTTYTNGIKVVMKATNTCTGASTLNVNAIGAKKIVNVSGTDTAAGDIVENSVLTLRYSTDIVTGGAFVIQTAVPGAVTVAAAASATAAAASAVDAEAAQAAAEAASNAEKWVSGTTYVTGDVTWSPIDFLSYRRKTDGAGTTDPSVDPTNWAFIADGISDTTFHFLVNS